MIGKNMIDLREVAGDGYAVQQRFPIARRDGAEAGFIELKLCLYPPLNVEVDMVDPELRTFFEELVYVGIFKRYRSLY